MNLKDKISAGLSGLLIGGGLAMMVLLDVIDRTVVLAQQSAQTAIFSKPWVLPKELIARWKLQPAKGGGPVIPLLGEDAQVYALDDWVRAVNGELADSPPAKK